MKRKIILSVTLLLLGFGYSNAQYGPVVSFTYDDGSDTWYNIGFPIFQQYGFPGVAYINATNWWIQAPGTISKLLEMQAAGWEISSHTYDHSGITESTVSNMKNWLDTHGFPNSGFAAPNNDWNHNMVKIVKKYHPYYSTATELPGMSQPFDLYFLERINLTNHDNIQTIRGYLDNAVTNHKWIIFIAHEFGGTYGDGSTGNEIRELLTMVFNEIVARGIPVKTVREVLNDLYSPGCVIECSRDTMQYPVLTYFEEGGGSFSTSVWNEYWHNTSWTDPHIKGSPVVYCHTSNKSLPVMKFYRNVPNGEYEVIASIIERDAGRTYRLYYSFVQGNPSQYNVQVNKNSDVSLGTVSVTNGQFALYTQKADAVSGGDGYVGWAFIKLIAKPLLINLKVFLEGPYNGSGAMTTNLNTNNLIPLNSDNAYPTATYGYTASVVGSIPNSNIVDWVLIELRTGTALGTKVSTRAAFLKNDGTIVDTDGSSLVSFPSLSAGNYYIVVRHRDHLAIMTASAIALSISSSLYDFTTSQMHAYGTDAMKDLGNGKYGMIAGDIDADGNVDYASDLLVHWLPYFGYSGYYSGDINQNGDVDYAEDLLIHWLPNFGFSSQVP